MSRNIVKRIMKRREDISKVVDYLVLFDVPFEEMLHLVQWSVDQIRDYNLPFEFGAITESGVYLYITSDYAVIDIFGITTRVSPSRSVRGSRVGRRYSAGSRR